MNLGRRPAAHYTSSVLGTLLGWAVAVIIALGPCCRDSSRDTFAWPLRGLLVLRVLLLLPSGDSRCREAGQRWAPLPWSLHILVYFRTKLPGCRVRAHYLFFNNLSSCAVGRNFFTCVFSASPHSFTVSFKLFSVWSPCKGGMAPSFGWMLWISCVPSETHVEVLTPSACECDHFWKQALCRQM